MAPTWPAWCYDTVRVHHLCLETLTPSMVSMVSELVRWLASPRSSDIPRPHHFSHISFGGETWVRGSLLQLGHDRPGVTSAWESEDRLSW